MLPAPALIMYLDEVSTATDVDCYVNRLQIHPPPVPAAPTTPTTPTTPTNPNPPTNPPTDPNPPTNPPTDPKPPTNPPPSSTRYGAWAVQDQQGFYGWALYWNADSEAAARQGALDRCNRIEPRDDYGCFSSEDRHTFQSGQCAAVFTYLNSYLADVRPSIAIGNSRSEAEAAALNYCTRIDDASECAIAQSADGARASVCIGDAGAPSSLLSPAAPTNPNPPTDPNPPAGDREYMALAVAIDREVYDSLDTSNPGVIFYYDDRNVLYAVGEAPNSAHFGDIIDDVFTYGNL